jgi:signal transduction histidine kinase
MRVNVLSRPECLLSRGSIRTSLLAAMSTSISAALCMEAPLAEALRRFELFRDLTNEELQWFVEHASDEVFEEGALLVQEGDEADAMSIIVEGQIRFQSSMRDSPVMIVRPGIATGLLPYSRLQRYAGNAYALTRLRVARVHRDKFPDMLRQVPQIAPRLVAVMSDRIREATRLREQHEKLKALGKLAAGLAHELNNPASAALRSAEDLQQWVILLRDSNQELAASGFDARQFQCLLEIEHTMLKDAATTPKLESVERSDTEETLAAWLVECGVKRGWEFAPVFVEAGVERACLAEVVDCFSDSAREPAIARLASSLAIDRITKGIQTSTRQISELVETVKGYSFVDQAPEQEIDLNAGLDNTLMLFSHRLRNGIEVVRQYDETLPRITANGPELNQVWTHLIDNALDAMGDEGTLHIRTDCEPQMVLVEIGDTGKGIPPEIEDRIFDPFFTTKDVGAGRGLGLDLAFRIVQKHRGDIRFTSRPGDTNFQVRLPMQNIGAF